MDRSVTAHCSLSLCWWNSNGSVYTTGVNEHGRMGVGREIPESRKPIRVKLKDSIGEMSCASFHCGFISFKNKLYTCGVGNAYRLGHENEETYYEPTFVQSLSEVKCARVECVEDRTFVTTKYGAVLMFGVEPVTRTTYKKPFVFEFLRTHRIYQVCGAKDFTVALGVQAKEQVQAPQVETDPNVNIQLSEAAGNNATNSRFGGGMVQPPMVPLDANPGFNQALPRMPYAFLLVSLLYCHCGVVICSCPFLSRQPIWWSPEWSPAQSVCHEQQLWKQRVWK